MDNEKPFSNYLIENKDDIVGYIEEDAILASNPFKLSVLYLTVINKTVFDSSKITELAESIESMVYYNPSL